MGNQNEKLMSIQSDEKHFEQGEIDLKKLFRTIFRFKYSIAVFALLCTSLAAVYTYLSPNVYLASATIQINGEDARTKGDFMAQAFGQIPNNIDNEIAILNSRFLAQRVLDNLAIGTRYFMTKHFKESELYKQSPFVVAAQSYDNRLIGRKFTVLPHGKEQYRLIYKPSLKERIIGAVTGNPEVTEITYDQLHRFGETVSTPWFKLTVNAISTLEDAEYAFSLVPNEAMDDYILENLTVSQASQFGTMLYLRVQDTVPLRAREILSRLTDAYLSQNLDIKNETAKKTLDFIDKQLANVNVSLQSSANSLQTYKTQNTLVNIESKATITATKLSDMETQLFELDMEADVLDNLLNYITNNRNISNLEIGSTSFTNQTISGLLVKIQEAVTQRASLLVDYTELHPDVIKVTEQIESMKKTLTDTIKGSLRSIHDRQSLLKHSIAEHTASLERLPKQERELTQLSRKFMINEKVYEYLLQKRAEAAILESSNVSEIRILDTADVGKFPIKPKRELIVLIGCILGLILGTAYAFLRSFLDTTIKTVENVESETNLPIYGVLPNFADKNRIGSYHEALRVTRTNLAFLKGGISKVLTVTSSVAGEGKTTTVAELAKILAKSSKKVIILDIDMRRSRLHEHFGLHNTTGMSTLLSGRDSFNGVLQKTKHDNLDIITSGPVPPDPSELIMSDEMKMLVDALRMEYDYIILDSPPIGLVTDAMLTMRYSDFNLVVLRAGYTKRDFLKKVNGFVKHHGINVGLILNSVDNNKKAGYGYGYGYNYGYSNAYYNAEETAV